jgi:hypothetical protein
MFFGCSKEEPTIQTDNGRIYGVVMDNNGNTVAVASITLCVGYDWNSKYTNITTLAQTISGSDGQYEFNNIETDLYNKIDGGPSHNIKRYHYLIVEKEGYQKQFLEVDIKAGKLTRADVLLLQE